MPIPLSVLDLAPVSAGTAPGEALRRTVELARLAEELGFVRHWFAEHHSMPSVASSAPEILIAHVAANTRRLRVGSGGIMLPNHVPLKIAEVFHTLSALYPGRIDFGIGRAPGSDHNASRALRAFDGEQFPALLAELLAYSRRELPEKHPLRSVRVMPDDVALPPIWLLGSSGASAAMAGESGMGYGFASHFSPAPAAPAMRAYREHFRPSPEFPEPHAILCVSVICADSQDEAEFLAGTVDLMRLRIGRGEFLPLPSPEEARAYPYTEAELAAVRNFRQMNLVGTAQTVHRQIMEKARETSASEVMVTSNIYGHRARLHSFELLADAFAAAP